MTHVPLPNGEVFEVLNIIDDHSRVCVASRVMNVVKAHDVVRVLHKSAETWGYPASFLTTQRASRPYHPQTCGKVCEHHDGAAPDTQGLPAPQARCQEPPGPPGPAVPRFQPAIFKHVRHRCCESVEAR